MARSDHERLNRSRAGASAAREEAAAGSSSRIRSPWAPAKQMKRVRELAAELGIDPPQPVPPAERVTKRDAGRFIDDCLMRKARG